MRRKRYEWYSHQVWAIVNARKAENSNIKVFGDAILIAVLHRSPLQKQVKTFLTPKNASAHLSLKSGGGRSMHTRSVARSWSSPSFLPSMILRHHPELHAVASTPVPSKLVSFSLNSSLQSPSLPRERHVKHRLCWPLTSCIKVVARNRASVACSKCLEAMTSKHTVQ